MLKNTDKNEMDNSQCPVRHVLVNVSGKWQPLILFELKGGPLRFSALKRSIGDITQRVLTQNLRTLERDGYLLRSVNPGPPVEVFYELTSFGINLVKVLKPLMNWASDNFNAVMDCRADYDQRV